LCCLFGWGGDGKENPKSKVKQMMTREQQQQQQQQVCGLPGSFSLILVILLSLSVVSHA
jgi:hypothetical protein